MEEGIEQKIEDYAKEAAVAWTTGRVVHIFIEEKNNKQNKRKRMQESLKLLDDVGLDEGSLHKTLGDQIKKVRLEGV